MPTYDYECEKCAKKFEVTRGFNEQSNVVCPKCKGKARRVYSAPPLIFKGSGFYVTDHRKKESSEGGEASKPEPKKAGGKIETTDTKPHKAEPPGAKPKS
jgi:putative FmdB family regulatory protein